MRRGARRGKQEPLLGNGSSNEMLRNPANRLRIGLARVCRCRLLDRSGVIKVGRVVIIVLLRFFSRAWLM